MVCAICSGRFDPARVNQLYCGPVCREVARNNRRREVYAGGEARPRYVLTALVDGQPIRVHAERTIGLLVWCPCGGVAGISDIEDGRECVRCGAVLILNSEEVEAACAGLITA